MNVRNLLPNLSQESLDEAATIPVVQTVDHYFHMNGYEKTKGLIADLIKYVDQLEMNGMPLQNVVGFNGITKLPIDPQKVIKAALDAGLDQVVICGFDSDGSDYFAASEADAQSTLYHLSRAKHRLMQVIDDEIA